MRLIDADLLLERMKGMNMLFSPKIVIDNMPTIEVNEWIPVSERLPEDTMQSYLCQTNCGLIDILGFTKDAYKLDKYDFFEYKYKKKALFYEYDSEWGFYERDEDVVAWMPLPKKYEEEVKE